jgi:potassium-dependent mechanosensitive channel
MQWLERFNQLVSAPLFRAGEDSISLVWLVKLILSLLLVLVLTNLLKQLLRNYILRWLRFSQGSREAISTLISYSIGVLSFLVVLSINGLNLASLAVVLGGLGVGVGFGLQDLTKNLVSGLTLLLEGKLQVGDYIEFQNLSGYIKEIAMRSTIVRTFDGGDVVIPNSNLVGNQVLNWSYKSFTGKLHLPVGVAYDSDPVLVTETLLSCAYMEPSVLYDPPPKVIFKGFGENTLNFELWVWIGQIDTGITIRSALNYIIEYNFRQAGIKIPVPQRELWLQRPEKGAAQNGSFPLNGSQADGAIALTLTQPVSIRQVLRQLPYFQNTSDIHLRGIIEVGYRKLLTDSEILFKEEDLPQAVYVVLSGEIQVTSLRLNQFIRTYQAGEFFGETPVLLGVPYLATATSVGKTSVFVIPKANFEKLLKTCQRLCEIFSAEVMKEQQQYADLRQQLQNLGYLKMTENHHNFVSWVRTRFNHLFTTS